MFRRKLWCSLFLLLTTAAASAQNAQPQPRGQLAASILMSNAPLSTERHTRPRWIAPVSSAVIPGSGQLMTGRDRGILYVAAEAFLMLRFWSLRSEARGQRDSFMDLAFSVARAPFRPAIRDTVFEYFEAMEIYVESGPFNTNSGPELVPPTDESTFNGRIWRLARETFLQDPDGVPNTSSEEYRRAVDFYSARAIGANFQWSWRDAGLERDLFSQSIRRSDAAFSTSTQYLGLILVNHLVSAIDGFISERLGSQASLNSTIAAGSYRREDVVARVTFRVDF